MEKEVKGVDVFVKLTDILAQTMSKKKLTDAYDKLTIEEKKQLFIYTKCKTPDAVLLNIRNHVENFLAR